MNVVWHGHYLAYFEEGRRAFGRRYDLDYPIFLEHNVVAPLVRTSVEYLGPARVTDVLRVTTRLLDSEGAKLEFEFEIARQEEGKILARGTSTQVFTTLSGELMLTPPQLILDRRKRWESEWLNPE